MMIRFPEELLLFSLTSTHSALALYLRQVKCLSVNDFPPLHNSTNDQAACNAAGTMRMLTGLTLHLLET